MRHAVTDLGAFGIVEPVHRTDEVARDAPDALELHAVADFSLYDGEVVELTHGGCVHGNRPFSLKHPASNKPGPFGYLYMCRGKHMNKTKGCGHLSFRQVCISLVLFHIEHSMFHNAD